MNYIKEPDIKDIILNALKEDIGSGDITTQAIITKDKVIKAQILAKDNFVVCGIGVVLSVFKLQDKDVKFTPCVKDGDFVKKGKTLAVITGRARSILAAERVALNFLSMLSGISSKTRQFVDAVSPYKIKILDTRKTIPGLRLLEKYAVRIGGGFNHRFCLDDMLLVKDNHLKVIGGVDKLTGLSRKYKSEIEVGSIRELMFALKLNPDIIMLDNMNTANMKKACRIKNKISPKTKLEASGGISLKNIRKIASCGIDMISVGDLTDSVKSVDISLEVS